MIIAICIGSSCHLKGSRQVVEALQAAVRAHGLEGSVEFCGRFCMGDCQSGVCLTVDGQKVSVRPEDVPAFFAREVLPRILPRPEGT